MRIATQTGTRVPGPAPGPGRPSRPPPPRTSSRAGSAGELPVPRLRQRPLRLGPVRVEPAVEGRVLPHPEVGRVAEVLDAAAQVDGVPQPVLARPGLGRP